ncbi:dihydroxy-acid dehydratase [Sagittula sp. P11]|uniref:dihydroxy-acid dehydratase n=1 Tax=Sagittula sp. P11 TaxID=2009329 RepID=UPI000C2CF300|nr:dihydroxy-acid dehydratase [Sagittula sp. P11]AUC53383.1 dihydroxy-acid dehydratase [Sagittula sp. P11]
MRGTIFTVLAAALWLAACDMPATDLAGASTGSKPPLEKVSLAGGSVVVDGPEGYCIDPETSRSRNGQGVAVIASCYILSGGKAGYNVPPVIVTVTVGPKDPGGAVPDPAALAKAAGAPLLGAYEDDGLTLAHLGSGGDKMLSEGDQRYWRGAFLQGGHMVGLALYAPEGDAMAGRDGARMLGQVRDFIVRASP